VPPGLKLTGELFKKSLVDLPRRSSWVIIKAGARAGFPRHAPSSELFSSTIGGGLF
jgi:hypothetical protein